MTQPHETAGDAVPRHRFPVCPPLGDDELNALFAASWPGHRQADFQRQLRRSMLWIAAVRDGELHGYVKVVGDGGVHAFLLDPTVHPAERGEGLGAELVRRAADEARLRGAEWLHVGYEPHLTHFYARCGFRPTPAGLLRLDGAGPGPG